MFNYVLRNRIGGFLWWALLALVSISLHAQSLQPPVATQIPKADTVFGVVLTDNYFWLRDDSREDPDVLDYLNAENDYALGYMKDTEELQKKLYDEIIGRIKETDLSVPTKIDDYYYYSRTEQGKNYQIHCRKKGSLDAAEEVLIDENTLAEGKAYFAIGAWAISPNHELLAFSTDTTGGEVYTLYVKNLKTGAMYSDQVEGVGNALAWAADNATIFYDVLDPAWRPYRILRHQLGADAKSDKIVYEEPDDRFFVSVSLARDKHWLVITIGSKQTSEAWYLDAMTPQGEFKVVEPRKQDVEYYVEPHSDCFYILTNENARNFKLMQAPADKPSKANWVEYLPYDDNIKLESVNAFNDYIVLSQRQNGMPQIKFIRAKDKVGHLIDFADPAYSVMLSTNPDYNQKEFRFTFMSLTQQKSVYDYNPETRHKTLLKQDEIPSGYDASQYQSERIFATAEDGVKIPITLVYRKDRFQKDGTHPCYLTGYGAYGAPMDPWFSVSRLSLLDRGFVYALAQIRGGGEYGRQWYDDGKFFNKKNTFTDFIACAQHLVREQYTNVPKLAISGGSAGGLLIGAVLNMRPDMFGAVVADVPFVDLINTMSDSTIPLTVTEYEEWGNPHQKDYFHYMLSYSPYDNVQRQAYPPLLITAGLNDPRVGYWEGAKFAAKLRAHKVDNNVLLLKTNMGAGHGGASGRYERYKEIAFEYGFILKTFGMAN